ncbi:MAG: hypothetical protein ACOZNI_06605 [Myxococcota bacterium]
MPKLDPLLPAIAVQGGLLFPALGRFDPWGDELFTMSMAARPLADMLHALRLDVHPPLWFALARLLPDEPAWMRLPGVLAALLATVALDRLWLAGRPERARALALWATSPCLLLYAPMARSYTLQILLSIVAIAGLVRLRSEGSRAAWALAILGTAGLAWTHYLPALAIGAVALAAGGARVRLAAGIGLATLLPWGPAAIEAVARWWERGGGYLVSGNPVLEHVPRLGWWALSFAVGESSPGEALPAMAIAVPFVLWAAARGARDAPLLPALIAVAALGYWGVSRWSSYPFVPARMLFLLPLFVVAVARGLGNTGTVALVGLHAVAIAAWTDGRLLNRGYATPHREMAAAIHPCELVLVDTANSDDTALRRFLPDGCEVVGVADDAQAEAARARAGDRAFWYWRNTHDVTGGVHVRLAARLAETHVAETRTFGAYSGAERMLMAATGWKERPTHQFVLEWWEPADGVVGE